MADAPVKAGTVTSLASKFGEIKVVSRVKTKVQKLPCEKNEYKAKSEPEGEDLARSKECSSPEEVPSTAKCDETEPRSTFESQRETERSDESLNASRKQSTETNVTSEQPSFSTSPNLPAKEPQSSVEVSEDFSLSPPRQTAVTSAALEVLDSPSSLIRENVTLDEVAAKDIEPPTKQNAVPCAEAEALGSPSSLTGESVVSDEVATKDMRPPPRLARKSTAKSSKGSPVGSPAYQAAIEEQTGMFSKTSSEWSYGYQSLLDNSWLEEEEPSKHSPPAQRRRPSKTGPLLRRAATASPGNAMRARGTHQVIDLARDDVMHGSRDGIKQRGYSTGDYSPQRITGEQKKMVDRGLIKLRQEDLKADEDGHTRVNDTQEREGLERAEPLRKDKENQIMGLRSFTEYSLDR
ncbi:hypothetical protein BJ878DRAFT_475939 [Calycina marina]|uniref:Uncharacterized protein n=1 Tax=Calycina marina TaxID=1763456 RepID=A0A9P7ZBE7_9HELO|nr:hypothetical protein BJ878DRAFT_475939 [Calycina marina]